MKQVRLKIYGYRKLKFKQRFWKRRKDGKKQRYWKKVTHKVKYGEEYIEAPTGKEAKKKLIEKAEEYEWEEYSAETPKKEKWKKIGKVTVIRDSRGRFVKWWKE